MEAKGTKKVNSSNGENNNEPWDDLSLSGPNDPSVEGVQDGIVVETEVEEKEFEAEDFQEFSKEELYEELLLSTSKVDDLEKQNKALQEELTRLREVEKEAEGDEEAGIKEFSKKDLWDELEISTAKVEDLENQIADYRRKVNDQVQDLQKENQELRDVVMQLDSDREELIRANKDTDQGTESLDKQLQDLQKAHAELRDVVVQLEYEKESADLKVRAMELEVKTSKRDSEETESKSMAPQFAKKLKKLKDENKRMETEMQGMVHKLSDAVDLENQVVVLEQQAGRLREALKEQAEAAIKSGSTSSALHDKEDSLLRSQVALTKALEQSCLLIRRAGQEKANTARQLSESLSNLKVSETKVQAMQDQVERRDRTSEMLARVDLAQDVLVKARANPLTDSVALMRVCDMCIDLLQGVVHPNKHADPKGNEVLQAHWLKSERDVQYLQGELNRVRRVLILKEEKDKKKATREEKRQMRTKAARSGLKDSLKMTVAATTTNPALGTAILGRAPAAASTTAAVRSIPKKSPYATTIFAYDENAEQRALNELIDLRENFMLEEKKEETKRRSSLSLALEKKAKNKKDKGTFWVLPAIGGHSDHPLTDLDPEVTVGRLNVGFLNTSADDD